MDIVAYLWCWQIVMITVTVSWLAMHKAMREKYMEYIHFPRPKQIYVVKNVVKSIILGSISPLAIYVMSKLPSTTSMSQTSYASLDARMPRATSSASSH